MRTSPSGMTPDSQRTRGWMSQARKHAMESLSWRVKMAVCAVIVGLGARAGVAQDACMTTANAGVRSCQLAARSDKWLALGTCANLPSTTARNVCARQARADARDALDTCDEESDLRDAV